MFFGLPDGQGKEEWLPPLDHISQLSLGSEGSAAGEQHRHVSMIVFTAVPTLGPLVSSNLSGAGDGQFLLLSQALGSAGKPSYYLDGYAV